MPIYRFLLMLIFLLVHSQPGLASPIHISETEYRSFRTLTLDSGLEILLVQDHRATKASAAIALPVGHVDEPDSQLGLAHYLEHMLFLGSAAYPEPGSFQSFVNGHGGHTNAATGYTSTIYVLEIDPPAFGPGLERLADTLAHPLLDPIYADKERNAVHAEMESKKYNDGRRLAMLTLGTMNPEHPVTRFVGGNLETLSDKPDSVLQEELVNFHRTWYCAGLMKAVLYGPQDLDTLETIARNTLTIIPHQGASISPEQIPPVTAKEQGLVFSLRPVHHSQSITMEFVLPQDLDQKDTKPVQVVASVLGTETNNSLVQFLRQQGWVLGLSVGADSSTLRNGVILSLSMELTEAGAKHRQEIVNTIFNYLHLLRTQKLEQKYFDQLQKIRTMQFRYAPITSGLSYVYQSAATMLKYPVQDVHFAPYRLDYFDQEAVARVLTLLTPAQARIFHVGPDQPVDQKTYFYETKYSVRPLKTLDLPEANAVQNLQLPDLNPYIPQDFSVLKTKKQEHPQKIMHSPGLNIWQGWSDYHHEPKAMLMTHLHSTAWAATLDQKVMHELLQELLTQTQSALRYQAQEAGLGISIGTDQDLVITISGFSEHQCALLPRILKFLDQPVDPQALEQAKNEYLRQLDNEQKQNAFQQATSTMGKLLKPLSWSAASMKQAAQNITLEDFNQYLQQIRQDLSLTIFGFGNLAPQALLDLGLELKTYVGPQAQDPVPWTRILPIKDLVVDYRHSSALEDSALVEVFLDPDPTWSTKARILVLEGLLSNDFFRRLRTEEQLGYIATTMPIIFGHTAGLGFGVQSPVQGTAGLWDRFNSFYFWALEKIRSTTEQEFENVRQGLVASLQKTPDTLRAEFNPLVTDLRMGNAHFDSQEQLIAALKTITLDQVIRSYETLVLGRLGTQVLLQVQGTRHEHLGWAKHQLAMPIKEPQDFHALVGRQSFTGL